MCKPDGLSFGVPLHRSAHGDTAAFIIFLSELLHGYTLHNAMLFTTFITQCTRVVLVAVFPQFIHANRIVIRICPAHNALHVCLSFCNEVIVKKRHGRPSSESDGSSAEPTKIYVNGNGQRATCFCTVVMRGHRTSSDHCAPVRFCSKSVKNILGEGHSKLGE